MDLPSVYQIVEAVSIIAGALLLGELLIRVLGKASKRAGLTPSERRTLRNVVTVIWISLAVFGSLRVLDVTSDLTTLTFSGVLGIGLTLALQATLQNIIAGILLIADGTLRLDDEIEYGGIKGQVVLMGFRSTWVMTEKGSIAIVSNSSLVNGPMVNHTATKRLERKLSS